MLKKLIVFIFAACVLMLFFSACELGESHDLEGDWTMSTTPDMGNDYDDTFSLDFVREVEVMSITFEIYQGHGTLGGVNFDFYVTYTPASGELTITIYPAGDDPGISDNFIDFQDGIYSSGNPVTGTYDGAGPGFFGNAGDFTAVKE